MATSFTPSARARGFQRRSTALPLLGKIVQDNHRRPEAQDCINTLLPWKIYAGEAREVINGFLSLETSEAYTDAKKVLSDRFGNPFLFF